MALGVALALRSGRCATQPHCNACQQNSRGPPPPQQREACNQPQHRHTIVLFHFVLFTFSVCLFSLSPTAKKVYNFT
ncbi:hypothetical protein TCDM_12967 [Trypanosoma cruzi Dm28c]|uniref:Uncharacterized protein n=1 Tax=Trypanosoma cruzi Dm28c TaxID=1416333 RepID=V5ATZ7_TRYCR|nr:hypothetical protein TCDM_12967 [Trypanosoma cruzi Dm28c]